MAAKWAPGGRVCGPLPHGKSPRGAHRALPQRLCKFKVTPVTAALYHIRGKQYKFLNSFEFELPAEQPAGEN